MYSKSSQNFSLLELGVQNDSFLANINQNEKTQSEFIGSLEQEQLSPQQILKLIEVTKEKQVKSLLIIHLLNQESYLSCLKGESILNRLDNKKTHIPSRLNALIHQLDGRTLTEALINKLHSEAAVSVLCSIPHFHQLNLNQVSWLLNKSPKPMIPYWINHFTTMPNSHFILSHLFQIKVNTVSDELNTLDELKKEELIFRMILNLNLFNPSEFVLQDQQLENRLNLAIRLFNNVHNHAAFRTFISEVTEKLINQQHSFSPLTVQLLISISSKPEFKELKSKTAYQINRFLRASAQEGQTNLFHDADQMNITSMLQPIELKTDKPNPTILKGVFDTLLGSENKETTQTSDLTPENPLIKTLIELNKPVKAFDYFLIHFKGNSTKLSQLISEYLSYFKKASSDEKRSTSIYHLFILLNQEDVDKSAREAIFHSFLLHPELFDEQISYCLLRYDAKRAIQHFGSHGGEDNYARLIQLCTNALKKLHPDKEHGTIAITKAALEEARFELDMLKNSGFFSRLFSRFKRCWRYGWTGFLTANIPTYVVPCHINVPRKPSPYAKSYTPQKTLLSLLKDLNNSVPADTATLDALIKSLNLYSLEAKPKDELETRRTVNTIFHKLLLDSKSNKGIENWLVRQQNPLLRNRMRFVELLLEQGLQTEFRQTIKEIIEDSSHLQLLTQEFNCPLPELSDAPIKTPAPPDTSFEASATDLVVTATGVASKVASAFYALGGIFRTQAEPKTTAPVQVPATGSPV